MILVHCAETPEQMGNPINPQSGKSFSRKTFNNNLSINVVRGQTIYQGFSGDCYGKTIGIIKVKPKHVGLWIYSNPIIVLNLNL